MSGDDIIRLTRERLPERPVQERAGFKDGGIVPEEYRGGDYLATETFKQDRTHTIAMDIGGHRSPSKRPDRGTDVQ